MKYPHHLLLVGASGGDQDDDGGYNPGGPSEPVYDGPCDAQEVSSSGFEFQSGDTKLQEKTADLRVFLKDESKINDIKLDMQGTLTRGARTDTVKVMQIRLLDGVIEVNTV